MNLTEWSASKRAWAKNLGPLDFRGVTPSIKDFFHAVSTQRGPLSVIAELARASPEEGVLKDSLDIEQLVRAIDGADVSAIAVATDSIVCGGSDKDLSRVAQMTMTPTIARDLFISRDQVYRARLAGADAVLLTAGVVDPSELRAMMEIARSTHMVAPVEVNTEQDAASAIAVGARLFVIPAFSGASLDLSGVDRLLEKLPTNATVLVRGPFADAEAFEPLRGRVDGIWLAGPLMRSNDAAAFLKPMVEAAENG